MTWHRLFGPGMPAPGLIEDSTWEAQPRTALPVLKGSPRHLQAHLQRLLAGAAARGQAIYWLLDLQGEIGDWLHQTVPHESTALRLKLQPNLGLVAATLEALPVAPQPYRLVPLSHPMGHRRGDASLIHKGLAGPWGRPVLDVARKHGAEDGLLLWPDGTLAETAIASLAVELEGRLLVPPPEGRVTSVAERLDLPDWAEARGLRIEPGAISLQSARQGSVWCLNALRGVWRASLP